MSLDMSDIIDDDFESITAQRYSRTGSYVNGIWTNSSEVATTHIVNLQAASMKEIQSLTNGGERINDVRKIYVNDGIDASLSQSDVWEFSGLSGRYKTIQFDNRPWRNYCKILVSKIDE